MMNGEKMERKNIKIVSLIILTCILAGITLTGCKNDRPDPQEHENDTENVIQYPFLRRFSGSQVDEVKSILTDNGIEIISADEASVFGFDRYKLDGLSLSAFFSYNESQITDISYSIETDIAVSPTEAIDEKTVNDAKEALSKIIKISGGLFGVDVSSSYSFYGKDGSIVSPDSADMEQWLKSELKFSLFVRDTDSSFWKIYGEMIPLEEAASEAAEDNEAGAAGKNTLVFRFDCISDPEMYKDVTADITLK